MNTAPGPHALTIAIPVYNEEAILVPNTRRLIAFLDARGVEYQIIIGSNGSTDRTCTLGEQLARECPGVDFFHLPERGVGLAFAEFIRRARYPALVSLDMDLSVDLRFITDALPLIGPHAIVVGSKKLASQRRSLFRKAGSDTFLWVARRLMRLPYDDYSIGAKAYDVSFLETHVDGIDRGTSYVLDLCYAAGCEGRTVACVPADCEDRRVSRFNLPSEALYKFRRLFQLWLMTRRKRVPATEWRIPAVGPSR